MYMYTEQDIENIENRAYGYYALSLKELKEEARKEGLKGTNLKKIDLANNLARHTYDRDQQTKVQSFTVSLKGTSYTEAPDRKFNTSVWQHRKNGNKAYRGYRRMYLVNAADIILDVWEWGETSVPDIEIKKALRKWRMINSLLQSY